MVIWKYQLQIRDVQPVYMPSRAEILSAHEQDGEICIWAMVDPSCPKIRRFIEILGTGNPVPNMEEGISRKLIGTVVMPPYVWHVFEWLKETP